MSPELEGPALLRFRDLRVSVARGEERVLALRGLDLEVRAAETLALVGESGSGKTLTACAALRLLTPGARIEGGAIELAGVDLFGLTEREMTRRRGSELAMVFQEPLLALNPMLGVGEQVAEVLREKCGRSARDARAEATALLRAVGFAEAEQRFDDAPHRLSGGMRQRVAIAAAIAAEPRVLFADEPTSSLDAPLRAQILDLLVGLARERGMALVIATHDLALVEDRAERVAVLYAGRVVEEGRARDVLARPRHPYTHGLCAASPLRAIAPRTAGSSVGERGELLGSIKGAPEGPGCWPSGCAFRSRCTRADALCAAEDPPLTVNALGAVACHHPMGEPSP